MDDRSSKLDGLGTIAEEKEQGEKALKDLEKIMAVGDYDQLRFTLGDYTRDAKLWSRALRVLARHMGKKASDESVERLPTFLDAIRPAVDAHAKGSDAEIILTIITENIGRLAEQYKRNAIIRSAHFLEEFQHKDIRKKIAKAFDCVAEALIEQQAYGQLHALAETLSSYPKYRKIVVKRALSENVFLLTPQMDGERVPDAVIAFRSAGEEVSEIFKWLPKKFWSLNPHVSVNQYKNEPLKMVLQSLKDHAEKQKSKDSIEKYGHILLDAMNEVTRCCDGKRSGNKQEVKKIAKRAAKKIEKWMKKHGPEPKPR